MGDMAWIWIVVALAAGAFAAWMLARRGGDKIDKNAELARFTDLAARLADAQAAHKHMAGNLHFGKIVLIP